jgi:pimeloyl-ACP methyl ester carboxylesterase
MTALIWGGVTAALLLPGLWAAHLIFATECVSMGRKLRRSAPGEFVTLSDGVTHYRLQGPATGPAVVLVPGATLPLFVWNHLNDRLAAAGYRVLSYDLYGRGYSDRPWRRYDLELHDRQLVELLDALKIAKAAFIGLAFGMLIAAAFTARRPGRVERLVAMAPDGFGVIMASSLRLMQIPVLGGYLFSLIGTRSLMARLPTYSTDPKVIPQLQQAYEPTLRWRGFKRAVLSSIRHMPIHDAAGLYRQASDGGTPIQVIWGTRDRVTPNPSLARLREVFPEARLVTLEGAGHLPHYEDPERIATAIVEFLSETSVSGSAVLAQGQP